MKSDNGRWMSICNTQPSVTVNERERRRSASLGSNESRSDGPADASERNTRSSADERLTKRMAEPAESQKHCDSKLQCISRHSSATTTTRPSVLTSSSKQLASTHPNANPDPNISNLLRSRIESGDFPSAVYTLAQNGRAVFADALGDAVREPQRLPATLETIYDLASLTKPLITGMLCARLLERGEIALERSSREILF
jgi:CubicO group peptidase (beta-lactamase class C family)